MNGDGAPADVCLILEGTYPYVTGGVATWVHQLVSALGDIRFALFHVSASTDEQRTPRYELPRNVVNLVNVGIHGGDEPPSVGHVLPDEARQAVVPFHDRLRDDQVSGLGDLLGQISPAPGRGPSVHELIYGKPSWQALQRLYADRAPNVSFIYYFWTWRFTHLPIFRLLHAPLPEAAVYHTLSTGWAGLTAAMARTRTGRPMLLTEHGIYARERRLEIDQAEWIHVQRRLPLSLSLGPDFFKEQWSRFFLRLSRLAYAHADLIVTIFEGNRQAQIRDGADPARTLVIPNAIDPDRFAGLGHVPAEPGAFRIGFVGRVVSIKDVKTFIRAFKIVTEILPGAEALVVGPTDEDPGYAEECRALAATLGLGRRLAFTGRADVREVYPRLDLLVLTSLSEGLPIVVLEAGAAGVPVVATDVGGCRELLLGRDVADRALGPSGLLTPIADPAATAEAVLTLARDPGLRLEMGRAGQARVRAFYHEAALVESYRQLYRRLMGQPTAARERV